MKLSSPLLLALVLGACSTSQTTEPFPELEGGSPTQIESARQNRSDPPGEASVPTGPDAGPPPTTLRMPPASFGAPSAWAADLHIGENFDGPHRWPEPPGVDANPIEIATFATAVLFNTGPDQPSPIAALDGYLSAAFVTELSQTRDTDTGQLASRATVVDAAIDNHISTSSAALVRLTLERTVAEIGTETAGFEIVTVAATLTHDGQRWLIVNLAIAGS